MVFHIQVVYYAQPRYSALLSPTYPKSQLTKQWRVEDLPSALCNLKLCISEGSSF